MVAEPQTEQTADKNDETLDGTTFDAVYVKKLRAENEKKRHENKELATRLQELELKEQERSEMAKKEQGKFAELLESEKSEKAKIAEQLNAMKAQLESYQKQEQDLKTELIKDLPEHLREHFADLPLSKIKLLQSEFQGIQKQKNSFGAGGNLAADMPANLDQIASMNPAQMQAYIQQQVKRKMKG